MASVTLSPYKVAQYDVSSYSWSESSSYLSVMSGNNYYGRPISYGSAAFNASSYAAANMSVTGLKVLYRNVGSSGTLQMTFFSYSSLSSAQNVSSSMTVSTSLSSTADINSWSTVTVNQYAYLVAQFGSYFGIQVQFFPSDSAHARFFDLKLEITYNTYQPAKPTSLKPSSGTELAGAPISSSWTYKSSGAPSDIQSGSEIQYSENSGTWKSINLYNAYNSYSFPANTFLQGSSVNWRVRTTSNIGTSEWSDTAAFSLYTTKQPESLSPNGAFRNPASNITLSWLYVKSSSKDEVQYGSIVRYRANGETYTEVTINNILNTYNLPAGLFSDGDTVYWQVKTRSNAGESAWSPLASFTLAVTPPKAPLLIYPVNISVEAQDGIILQWTHNSEYDTNASRFDVRYRKKNGDWIELDTDGRESIEIPGIVEQTTVEWQVRAYGEYGDEGPWSEIASFFTIGAPPAPVIIEVNNSNLPTVYFSAQDLLSWELEILDNGLIVYNTGNMPFDNILHYKLNEFLPNGTYLARMRTSNQYSRYSAWAELPFTILTEPPSALQLNILHNMDFYIRLSFNNTGETVYIYRSVSEKDDFSRIAKTKDCLFDDYTVRPGQRYKYFVRIVDSNGNFSDSPVETAQIHFWETTIAEIDSPSNMLKFLYAPEGKLKKTVNIEYQKSLTNLIGRKYPILQFGQHKSKTYSFSFYCSVPEAELLEELSCKPKLLILRDWRLGSVYGTVNGKITILRDGDACNVNFSFAETDFRNEADLLD